MGPPIEEASLDFEEILIDLKDSLLRLSKAKDNFIQRASDQDDRW